MSYRDEYVSTQSTGKRNSSGKGYVILHGKLARKKYILDCELKGCVTIAFEDGGFMENVPVLKHVWNDIIFPDSTKELGSMVLWNSIPKSGMIVVIGIIPKNNEVNNQGENEFRISRTLHKIIDGKNIANHLEISGNAEAGIMNITVDGGEENGELIVNIFNKNKTANLKINTKGNITFDSSDSMTINVNKKILFTVDDTKTNFYYEKGKGFTYEDEFKNKLIINKSNIKLISGGKKINLGSGKEPLLLGRKTISLLNEILVGIQAITTPDAILGTTPIINIPQFTTIQPKLQSLLSLYSNTD